MAKYIDGLVYKLKFGGKPELAFQPINDYMIALKKRLTFAQDFPGINNVVASDQGKKIAFIGRSNSEPTDTHGQYNYEIFVLENGRLTQMTNLKTVMSMLAISKDGSTIAFGADETRTHTFDLWVLDLKTNHLHQMFLTKRFETLPEFNQ